LKILKDLKKIAISDNFDVNFLVSELDNYITLFTKIFNEISSIKKVGNSDTFQRFIENLKAENRKFMDNSEEDSYIYSNFSIGRALSIIT
jgi:Zn-dependent oligopeptidase